MDKNIYVVDFKMSDEVRYYQIMDIIDMERTLYTDTDLLIGTLEEKGFNSVENESKLFVKVMRRDMICKADGVKSHVTAYIRRINQ